MNRNPLSRNEVFIGISAEVSWFPNANASFGRVILPYTIVLQNVLHIK